MVMQVGTYSGQVHADRNSELLEMTGRSNAGAKENRRAAVNTGAEHETLRLNLAETTSRVAKQSARAICFNREAIDQNIADDRDPRTHRIEKGERCIPANSVDDILGEWCHP